MKHILAVIRPVRLEAVRNALDDVEVHAMTVSDVRGFGLQGGLTDTYRGVDYRVEWVQKVKLDIVVSDPYLEPALAAIKESAYTGEIGDGKIFVLPVEAAYRIRTGEVNEAALA